MDKKFLDRLIRRALREDVGREDLTTRLTVDPESRCRASVVAKQDGILSGIDVFRAVFDAVHADIRDWSSMRDGEPFFEGDTLASFEARTAPTLTGERTALNFLQRLCGIATRTYTFVLAVEHTNVHICDTRKTTPGLRALEKAAVRHGRGHNHRQALYDGVLIKDNHIRAAGGITSAVLRAKAGIHHLLRVEVEVTTVDECREAMAAGADVILLDNMTFEDMRRCVEEAGDTHVLFEASGNVTLDTVRPIAETGVDYISVGGLTHSAPAADLSLRIELLDA
jgi:nicotinate-nucleotide pyrophosphorylase (carboxylating)